MSLQSIKIDETAKTVTLVLDLDTPRPSSSGKTLLVATSRGTVKTDAVVDGKAVSVGVNAFIKA